MQVEQDNKKTKGVEEDSALQIERERRQVPPALPAIAVVIPAHDEAEGILKVMQALPMDWISEVVVTDNASNDDTAGVAEALGATVLREDRKGYGWACLKALHYLAQKPEQPQIVVFLDADYSDHPEELPLLVQPILEEGVDMVIGSRALGRRERGSLTPQQVFGNWLATRLLYLIYKEKFTDLGPFRAIRWEALQRLQMQDKTYGWTVEMQIKAAKQGLRNREVPVTYRRRIGRSKVSGTLKGVIGAGYKILWTLFRYSR
ncbi:glycosyltransferase family 2 protein [Cesiribacter andamanensis]|uniref:Putative glucosyl-3-phosphoglycerate synthase n=1 Tax=Cesiribacter andamanensis AMV16 TaxID=1279009 RepID=M7NQ92_9BACT|nr:glycosyltransferase family 2 protein [Cesiribacter andamanensis]EMR00689.1 putative glucosyl-3-phosphoglycerate synthase [Cesiribacter andamanensis AMV16]